MSRNVSSCFRGRDAACAVAAFLLAGAVSCTGPADRRSTREVRTAQNASVPSGHPGSSLQRSYEYTGLSPRNRYVLHFFRAFDTGDRTRDEWRLAIYDARSGVLRDSLVQPCVMLFYDTVPTRGDVRSYVSGYRRDAEALDNDYGDLVLADLNFDGLEDLALKTDLGGTSGCYYSFYLQSNSGRFHKSAYLTDSVSLFPATIDTRGKRLITFAHAGVRYLGEDRYRYDPATDRYVHEQHILHDLASDRPPAAAR